MLEGLTLYRIPQDSAPTPTNAVRYPALSLADLLVFLSSVLPTLFHSMPTLMATSCLISITAYACLIAIPSIIYTKIGLLPSPYPWRTHPSVLQDATIRLVRHVFTHFPHEFGRAFFSEEASLPFAVQRLGGRAKFSADCRRVSDAGRGVEGWWIQPGQFGASETVPDLVVMYIHGGGLTMGSPAFYLPFLHSLALELRAHGFSNPAVFAPSYGLVPEARYPEQLDTIRLAWEYATERVSTGGHVGIAGDSAGAGLGVALLLDLADREEHRRPDFMTLISPWTGLRDCPPADTPLRHSDFVSPVALQHFAHLYSSAQPRPRSTSPLLSLLSYPLDLLLGPTPAFDPAPVHTRHTFLCRFSPPLSPLDVPDPELWRRALENVQGVYISYGAGEVLAPQCTRLFRVMYEAKEGRTRVEMKEWGLCHAPEVVFCFLGRDEKERRAGVQSLAGFIAAMCLGSEE